MMENGQSGIVRARDVMTKMVSIDGMETAKEAARKMREAHATSLLSPICKPAVCVATRQTLAFFLLGQINLESAF